MHYAKIHFKDYASDTSHLSLLEHGVYFQMMRVYYTSEKPLPADSGKVARFIGARSDAEREAVKNVLVEFFTLEDDGWHQKRIDAEIERYTERKAINGEIGKLGGRPKKPEGNPQETETVSTDNPQITLTTNHKPITNKQHRVAFAPPDWVPSGPWSDWLEVRRKNKAPNTERALSLAVAELGRLKDQGHDPAAVLNSSVLNGYRGLFPPKGVQAQPTDWRKDPRFVGAV